MIVPAEFLGPLVDSTTCLSDEIEVRRSFAEHGYLLLRQVLERADVLSARAEVLERLAGVGEIRQPAMDGIATGASRRVEMVGDFGAFWKSVSEGPALRRVTHGAKLRKLAELVFHASARPHDYLFLRPVAVGFGTDLHHDHPYFGRGATPIATCWVPLGEISVRDGPLVIVEGSHRTAGAMQSLDITDESCAFAAARDAAYQLAARGARLLTAHFRPGDLLIFSGVTMHGSLDNQSPIGRVRLSVDVRYQPSAAPIDDPRFFGPDPWGSRGGGYGEQRAAQPLGTPWLAPH
jgi:hypothetical protein